MNPNIDRLLQRLQALPAQRQQLWAEAFLAQIQDEEPLMSLAELEESVKDEIAQGQYMSMDEFCKRDSQLKGQV